ncbi:NADase-type glycan-binding domain-containing protein [Streptomyces soliscabiei]|uniref:NADase-type glycan-binding domain-containing protein n=1 Tax=Streptomyces soliscabiei TaxID=588897 RepID=UPI0029AE357B|nr:hypothetical protein [Streptomyces sp. NY05-11A]MDX2678022.1 hypothetical protein [Streptomyces sp. NY05-11A]
MSGPGGLICPDCGHHNARGAAFCASCNAFLDWEQSGAGSEDGGQGTATAPRAAVAGPAASGPAAQGSVAQGSAAQGSAAQGSVAADASGAGPSVQGAVTAGPAPEPATARTASALPRPQSSTPAATQPQAQPTSESGASGTVRRPGERSADPDDLPAEPDTRDTPVTAPHPRTPVHDLVCPACAQANPRTRTLCLRCGAVLTATVAAEERLSWWARLRRRLRRRPPRRLAAGQRPAGRAWRRPSLAIPITLVVLLGGGYLARPHLSSLIDNLRDRTAKPTPVNPKFAEGSSHLKDHGPNLAFDGANNTYWAPTQAGPGTGEEVQARFEQPVTLTTLIIQTGISVNKDEFLKQARPSVLDVELGEPGGAVHKKQLKLEDKPGPQTLDLEGKNVSTVRFIVRSSYGAEGKNRHTAILEVEFFGRR